MKQLSNLRKADKAHGDDLTLTRWVKEPGRHTSGRATPLAPAGAERTRFPSRVLRRAADYIERGGSGFFSTENRNASEQA